MSDNELIAEFMGMWTRRIQLRENEDEQNVWVHGDHKDFSSGYWEVDELQYHTSWDWLMLVVEKCNEIQWAKEKEFPDYKNIDDATGWRAWSYHHVGLSTNIEQVYKNVVRFIKWYNQQERKEGKV